VIVRFFASIRDITREKEIEWGAPAPTLGALLHQLSDRYGPGFRGWVLDGERLGDAAIVLVNGQDARHQDGVNTKLAPQDVIAILPMMAGGAP
jgi:MoaD family protein